MLTALEIENFKGIGSPVRIELKPITLLFGPNNAGKSTILQAIQYGHEILTNRNVDPRETHHGEGNVDLGGFKNFVHRREIDRAVRLRFELDMTHTGLGEIMHPSPDVADESGIETEMLKVAMGVIDEPLDCRCDNTDFFSIQSAALELVVDWCKKLGAPILRTYSVEVDGEPCARIEASPDGSSVHLIPEFSHELFEPDDRAHAGEQPERLANDEDAEPDGLVSELAKAFSGFRIRVYGSNVIPRFGEVLPLGIESEDGRTSGKFLFPKFGYLLSQVLAGVGDIVRGVLAKQRYLGPIRDIVKRDYVLAVTEVAGGWARGLGAWNLLASSGAELARSVDDWLRRKDRLDTGFGLDISSLKVLREGGPLMAPNRRVTVRPEDPSEKFSALPTRTEVSLVDTTTGERFFPRDVGVGISQVLPVVVAALDPSRPLLTLIEQPELHIHPKMQVALGDLFASQIDNEFGYRRLVLETHSEHIMLRLLRRIEETHSGELPPGAPALRPDQVSVVFIEQIEGEVRATQLRIDESGEFIDRWPQGFFEERAEELF